jgi:hypothetical protein
LLESKFKPLIILMSASAVGSSDSSVRISLLLEEYLVLWTVAPISESICAYISSVKVADKDKDYKVYQ